MSYYAQVKNNVVQQVIVADQDFINMLPDSADWVQTSYNTRGGVHYAPNSNIPDGAAQIRYNYAGIGYNYDGIGFYSQQPFPSWILNKTTYLWEPPIPYPNDGKDYIWDETLLSWVEHTT